jgi:hypothetical protein
VTEAECILEAAGSVLVVDWPSRDVPDTLARAGYRVVVKGGPEPDNYSARELRDGEVEVRDLGRRPERVDLVYAHRPLGELPGLIATANALEAQALWCQSGLAGPGTKDPKGCWPPGKRASSPSRPACDTSTTSTSPTPCASSGFAASAWAPSGRGRPRAADLADTEPRHTGLKSRADVFHFDVQILPQRGTRQAAPGPRRWRVG